MKIRTRFAPSPTGYLHIGNIRSAFYSWLIARKYSGEFILRIEDSDTKRSNKEFINYILKCMKWLKIHWDKGPYFQTDRFARYNEIINKMIESKLAYYCYCSNERLSKLRNLQLINREKPRYDGLCRDKGYYENKRLGVVRFRNPDVGYVKFQDLIHGEIKIKNIELDDLIIRKSDMTPTYNFCVVVDDYDMNITHIVRGNDHINNTPRQINILKSLNMRIPKYVHLPVILGNNGKKLSKRNGAMHIMQYRDAGFLPESLLNYLIRLGWSYKNQEIFSIEEMKSLFDIKKVKKSNSLLNFDKLIWLNKKYIKILPKKYVVKELKWHIKKQVINIDNGPELAKIIEVFGERFNNLKEISENIIYLYKNVSKSDLLKFKEYCTNQSAEVLKKVKYIFHKMESFNILSLKKQLNEIACNSNIEMKYLNMLIRIAITGKDKTPSVITILMLIGKKNSIIRINNALKLIFEILK